MAATYDVTGQNQTTILDAGGSVTPAMQVTFRTKPSGVISSVRIPVVAFTPDEVDRAITAAVVAIEAVQAL